MGEKRQKVFSFGFASEDLTKDLFRYWVANLSEEEKNRLNGQYRGLMDAWNNLHQPKLNRLITQPPWGSEEALLKAGDKAFERPLHGSPGTVG